MQEVWLHPESSVLDLDSLLNSPVLAFDVEATGLHPTRDMPIGVSFAVDSKQGCYFEWGHEHLPWRRLEDSEVLKVAHNAVYDRRMLKRQGILTNNYADTMVAAHVLGEERLSLKDLNSRQPELHITTYSEIGGLNATAHDMGVMGASHARATMNLWESYKKEIPGKGKGHLFWDILMPMVPVLSDMELTGITVDRGKLEELGKEFLGKANAIAEAINWLVGVKDVNYNSPDQIAWLLFEKLGLEAGYYTRSGKRPSTAAVELERLKGKHPVVNLIRAYRQYRKLIDQYVDGMIAEVADGRIHTSFNLTGTRTGRLSSTGPNLQNIPMRRPEGKKIRSAFVASPGCVLLVVDYDQLELKDLALHSRDPYLLDAFKNNRDIHIETAIRAYGSPTRRFDAKTLNYQIVYGGGKIKHRHKFFEAYPGVAKWIQDTSIKILSDGYARTRHGRVRVLPEVDSSNSRMVAHGQREGISTIVQGSSIEEVFRGMIKAWDIFYDTEVPMLLQVHDEVVFELPENRVAEVAPVLVEALTCKDYEIPLTVSIKVGKNWRDLEKYNAKE